MHRLLAAVHGLTEEGADRSFEIVPITTSGDRIQDRALLDAGGKGLFTKEIEEALLRCDIDCAVHSMKDMETALPEGLQIGAILERADVRDAWISPVAGRITDLPQGARVGTSSLRRGAQVLAVRPDIEIVTFRGNVETRLEKISKGEADGTLLAAAGLERLGRLDAAAEVMPIDAMLPAVAQGAIGVEIRNGDEATLGMISPINHEPSEAAVRAERAFLGVLDGSCRTPIAALAFLENSEMLTLMGKVLSPDGKNIYEIRRSGPLGAPKELGKAAGVDLRRQAGEEFCRDVLGGGQSPSPKGD